MLGNENRMLPPNNRDSQLADEFISFLIQKSKEYIQTLILKKEMVMLHITMIVKNVNL